ncbi:hypothetical protein LZF95_14320 [Algoriphagus sp. AGSA1]|uniref:hypothetical protein n=1 Tax=Algoriphagus sp. AGSA1 TaxID=2907213 RepID=UPI001F1FDFF6|nr:hypothetical protein [Algoriphagus sp. AGSA1]MCE7055852.1 hypothetical protein [Algoriphagus sp. AGSA1]
MTIAFLEKKFIGYIKDFTFNIRFFWHVDSGNWSDKGLKYWEDKPEKIEEDRRWETEDGRKFKFSKLFLPQASFNIPSPFLGDLCDFAASIYYFYQP